MRRIVESDAPCELRRAAQVMSCTSVQLGGARQGAKRVTGPNGKSTETSGLVHLSDAEVAGYLDHDLPADERRRVEMHIDQCATCRREIVALLPITHPGESPVRKIAQRPRRWWIPAAAAAVIVALILPRLTRYTPGPDAPQRARPVTETGGRSQLAVVAPVDDATVDGLLVFTWRSTNADVYRIAVLTPSGDPVWQTETSDTSIALPDSVALQPGKAYFWRVDAIGSGIAATTGPHRLQIPGK
jgi:putative zinc finger protein